MYYGFKHTKAVTYDECINRIFGRHVGLFANLVIFVHVFGSVVSTWIFSYIFCDRSAQQFFGAFSHTASGLFKYGYFGVTLLIMFVCVSFVNIDRLKFIAILGFLILLYLVGLFVAYTPSYFNHYNGRSEFRLEGFIVGSFAFKTYGLTQYIFLNQYSIIPLCNNVKDVSFRRIKKVIFRAMCILFLVYFSVMVSGYFSQPSIALASSKLTELFILRPSYDGAKEFALIVGQTLFGVTLFIANLVKSQFFILYFHQMVKNTRVLMRGGTRNELLQKKLLEQERREREQRRSKEIDSHIKKLKRSNSAGRCIKFNVPPKQLPLLKEMDESKEMSEHEDSGAQPEALFQINIRAPGELVGPGSGHPSEDAQSSEDLAKAQGEAGGEAQSPRESEASGGVRNMQISFSKNNFENEESAGDSQEELIEKPGQDPEIKTSINVFKTDHEGQPLPQKKPRAPREKVDWRKVGVNAAVMAVTFVLTLTLMNSLSTFLSLIGNFVGVFEIFVFPFLIVIILNRRQQIVANWHLVGPARALIKGPHLGAADRVFDAVAGLLFLELLHRRPRP